MCIAASRSVREPLIEVDVQCTQSDEVCVAEGISASRTID